MNCLTSPLVAYPSPQPNEPSFSRRPSHPAADILVESFRPSNENFLDHVSKNHALRNFAIQFGGPRGSKCWDDSPRRDGGVEGLDRLARADDIRPMNGKEEKIFRDALALISRAGKRSKSESTYYAEMKPGFEALLKEGKVVVAPTLKNEFQTIGDRTRLGQNLLDLDDGTKEGHDSAVMVTAILLAHEWAHNKRGGAQTTHIPDKEGKANPYLSGIEMGRLIKEMYADDLKSAPPSQRAALQKKIDLADHWIGAHIEGGIGEGYEMNYDSRDIRHHVKRKRS